MDTCALYCRVAAMRSASGNESPAPDSMEIVACFEDRRYDLERSGVLLMSQRAGNPLTQQFYAHAPVQLQFFRRGFFGRSPAGAVSTTLGEILARQRTWEKQTAVRREARPAPAVEPDEANFSLPRQCEHCQGWFSSTALMADHVVTDHWGQQAAPAAVDVPAQPPPPATRDELERLAHQAQMRPWHGWWPLDSEQAAVHLELWLVGKSSAREVAGPAGLTALHSACLHWRPGVISALVTGLQHSVVAETRCAGALRPVDLFVAYGASQASSAENERDLVRDFQLLARGASERVLHHAVAGGVEALVRSACSPALALAGAAAGPTPLEAAAAAGRADLLRVMLAAGQPATTLRVEGPEALAAAARGGHDECVQALLAHPGLSRPFGVADPGGNSPLHLAACYCSADTVEAMLARGAAQGFNARCETPMHMAVVRGDVDVARALLAALRGSRYLWMATARSASGYTLPTAAHTEEMKGWVERELGGHFAVPGTRFGAR